jgi:hypothetical protein
MRALRKRLWLEVALASTAALLAVVTFVWHDWGEVIFGIDPDQGNGSFEVAVTIAVTVISTSLFLLPRLEWRRTVVSLR